jgi:glycosyltransferase involved in cell wall biosynthesis
MIGVCVHAEPANFHRTLEYLRRHTLQPFELVVLADGPDEETREALGRLCTAEISLTTEPQGGAACFNRLIRRGEADVFIMVESGAFVGPDWLTPLLLALRADPRSGLAGPSTNRAWSLQGHFPDQGGSPEEIAATAVEARRCFGDGWRPLSPLWCLADFCYAVIQDVVRTIGTADEAYGRGPCWEMDYTIRAVRAGFRAVWAQSSYVYRSPATPRRGRDESLLFAASKRRYQDKFCALKLHGGRNGYAAHCRGEDCAHFAPGDKIQITLPFPSAPDLHLDGSLPLVSCVMPTRARPDWAKQAVYYFLRQDYPNRELIILDEGDCELGNRLPNDPCLHYIRLPERLSIGAKRNAGCDLARGEIIAQWDDDDWYGPDRLSNQVAPILSGRAEITGLSGTCFFELDDWTFWTCSYELHRRIFVEDVSGGTLVYHRRVFQDLAKYPNSSLAEDAIFLRAALDRGARLERISAEGIYLYVRHGANTWRFRSGRYGSQSGWLKSAEPSTMRGDRAFYLPRSHATDHAP